MNTRVKMVGLLALLTTTLGFWIYSQNVRAQANAPLGPLGVCDIHKAFRDYNKTIELTSALTADGARIQGEITALKQLLKNMSEDLKVSGLLPGSPDFERRRTELLKKNIEAKNFADFSQNELRMREFRIRDGGYQDIYKAVKKVAAKRNLLLVFSREELNLPSQRIEDLIPNIFYRRHVIFADDSIDITAEVIEQLNTDYELR